MLPLLPTPKPQETTDPFFVSVMFPVPECHMIVIQYVIFSDWLLSLRNGANLGFIYFFCG